MKLHVLFWFLGEKKNQEGNGVVKTVVPIVVGVSLLAVLAVVGVYYWKFRWGAALSNEVYQAHINEVTRCKSP